MLTNSRILSRDESHENFQKRIIFSKKRLFNGENQSRKSRRNRGNPDEMTCNAQIFLTTYFIDVSKTWS